ncbi:serine/threonine protein phosphatase PrpC [Sphaerotilus hippei]|uniref:Serine/threonine protein phosphatase PrpC n=1 Tax=Sphaerotilus hippei TaxID=744406 RepID=A0A318GZI4_9BURK|nr:bifunctional protein-serine/threonine kinase/phosphatase [Sphaerotilus hippei]PXW93293.1 serine/threonine protein phosphatase PrpC [Sphaerotilus hippei]
MTFDVDIGHRSERGKREHNEDFVAVQQPQPHEEALGWIAALADGVSTGGGGAMAAQTTVKSLVQDYFGAPATWDTTVALERLISAQNAWLVGHNKRRAALSRGPDGQRVREPGSAMSTLTALVLRGHSYTVAHVGDSRAWLLRDGELIQLTQDHALDVLDFHSGLTRAIGLDDPVRIDFFQGVLRVGDVFLLTSDGVHGALKQPRLQALLLGQEQAQVTSDALVGAALAAGSRDNCTALVLRVRGLAAGRYDDVLLAGRHLPVPPRLRVGQTLDQYAITALVADTGVHRLYQARDLQSRELVALKTLHESRASDHDERAMLAHEAWLGLRLTERLAATESAGFVRLREAVRPSAFYAVFDWHTGQTLEQLIERRDPGHPVPLSEVVRGALTIARALGKLHRAGVVHRDIKPGNLHLGEDGQWRILDLGVAVSGREPQSQRSLHAGTPSYMNPEQWADPPEPVDARSDLYALGVTLYQWVTARLPYGEVEPYQSGRFRRDPTPPSRLRPDVPIWLDHLLLKAVARDARLRFETAEELVLALERGASRPVSALPATPLALRDPAVLWKVATIVSILFNLLLIFWLLFLPR